MTLQTFLQTILEKGITFRFEDWGHGVRAVMTQGKWRAERMIGAPAICNRPEILVDAVVNMLNDLEKEKCLQP